MFAQRNPNQPKAVWWKRFTETASLGKRIIYVVTPTLGFEIDGWPQSLVKRKLTNGVFKCNETVEYISIASITNGVVTPTKAIHLLGEFFMFNPETITMEIEDIVDEGVEIIPGQTSGAIHFENNSYIRQFSFDCFVEDDEQESSSQPIKGLLTDEVFLSLKTYNFAVAKNIPKHSDLLFYEGQFWMVAETRSTFNYRPRKQRVLHLTLKQIKK